jgi:hypothetical protein
MGEPRQSTHPEIYLRIAGGPNIGDLFQKLEWKSFTNGGYIIRARISDSYWNVLHKLATDFYLAKGRRQPTPVIFEFIWPGVAGTPSTGKHLAYMADMDARGINAGGSLEFIAVDPASFWLNAGDAAGSVYTGKVSSVIEEVLNKYFVEPNQQFAKTTIEVGETEDSDQNKWWMMRMDPKTFIRSMLDWSSSITKDKTNWIVSSGGSLDGEDPVCKIIVKEQAKRPVVNYGTYVIDLRTPNMNDVLNFEFLSDNMLSVFQKNMITQGISAVSERFLDRKMDKEKKIVHVHDDNTSQKKKTNIDPKHGFAKPGEVPSPETPHQWSTSILSVPEHNAGDLGVTYDKYIDGRARDSFLNMLNMVMRIKIRVTGEVSPQLADSHNLGTSKLKLVWIDADGQSYFMDGDWLVYGFHHIATRQTWVTDIYCSRLDYNANAQVV